MLEPPVLPVALSAVLARSEPAIRSQLTLATETPVKG